MIIPDSGFMFMDVRDFVADGYLQEVNRQVLHPLGLALALLDSSELVIIDARDDKEGIVFSDLNAEKLNSIEKIKRVRHALRKAALGFVVQEE